MIRIAVVDDEDKEVESLSQMVESFFRGKDVECSIKKFNSGEALLSSKPEYEIIFLDIQMGKLDGIETAQMLRTINKQAALFYVTSYGDYIYKSMTIHPFTFIKKPYSVDEIYNNLNDYMLYVNALVEKEKNDIYKLHTTEDHIINIHLNDILYFHYLENRVIDVITHNEKFKIKGTITNIYKTLDTSDFIIPNQSFIINLNNIKEIDGKNKKITMLNDDFILISRRKYKEIIEKIGEHISNERM